MPDQNHHQNHLFIAVDLGAESGRVVVGRLKNARLESEEIHRFATGAHRREGSWRWDLAAIEGENLTGRRVTRLHLVGGGSQNDLLNQFAANATGREVWAGPVEATANGNLGVQAVALGHLDSLAAWRQIAANTHTPHVFRPEHPCLWQRAATRFENLRTP